MYFLKYSFVQNLIMTMLSHRLEMDPEQSKNYNL